MEKTQEVHVEYITWVLR